MDDLISRWAAIDALTDTNLKRNVDSVCDGDMNRTRRAAQRVIANLPTIDAIPVEWLEKHRTEYFEDWGEEPVTIDKALIMWTKEQEAQDDRG